jgi:hypothetical protein
LNDSDCAAKKQKAHECLKKLEDTLSVNAPNKTAFAQWMNKVEAGKADAKSIFYEGLFLDEYVLPLIPAWVAQTCELSKSEILECT